MRGQKMLSVLCLAALLSTTKGEYLSCPYADMAEEDYGSLVAQPPAPIAKLSSSSYSAADHPNSIQKYGENIDLNLPVSTWVTRFLMNDYDADASHYGAHLSENMIFKSYFDAPAKKTTVECAKPPETCANDTNHYYYRSIDGSCNNLQNPGFGMANSRYGRLLKPKYGGADGYAPSTSSSGAPLPNARLLSLDVYGEESYPDEVYTLAFMQWGQIIAHDISKFTTRGAPEDCCSNIDHKRCYPIALHPFGPIKTGSDKGCIGFSRAVSDVDSSCDHHPNYAEKLSTVTTFIDLSSVYGSSAKENEKVRQYTGGLLKTSFVNNRQWLPISMNVDGECGEDNHKCYSIPDRRNQFIPSITIIQTVLLREHNRIACALAQLNPQYSDEKLYQEAKKINTAQYQKIAYYDWLPRLIGSSFAYANRLIHYLHDSGEYINDYDAQINPAAYAESAAAAFRYAHTQIPGYFSLVTPSRTYNETKRLSDFFEKPSNIDFLSEGDNFDSVLRGMVTQPQKKSDLNIDKEIKHHFNRKSLEEYGSDLKSLDIQRGRDFGLPSYNEFRQFCGLARANHWTDLANEISLERIEKLQRIYKSVDDIDLQVGGSLEAHSPGALLGPTFQCIMSRQFQALRFGDRFFYENENLFSGFSKEQLAEIRKVSLSSLLCNNADYLQFIQPDSFAMPNPNNAIRSCNLIPQLDLGKWKAVQQHTIY